MLVVVFGAWGSRQFGASHKVLHHLQYDMYPKKMIPLFYFTFFFVDIFEVKPKSGRICYTQFMGFPCPPHSKGEMHTVKTIRTILNEKLGTHEIGVYRVNTIKRCSNEHFLPIQRRHKIQKIITC